MDYLARHFVKIAGRVYTPGEIIDRPIPQEKLSRLLRIGAVTFIASTTGRGDRIYDPEAALPEARGSMRPWPDKDAASVEDAPQESGTAEGIQEEAPEIDAMDGVIAAPPSPAGKTEESPHRRKRTNGGRA